VTPREQTLVEAARGIVRALLPINMTLAERELVDDPLPDPAVLFSFMGSGASDHVTVGEYRAAKDALSAALSQYEDKETDNG